MKRTIIIISLVFFIAVAPLFVTQAIPWDENVTHRDLSKIAAQNSVLDQARGNYLLNLGIEEGLKQTLSLSGKTQPIVDWIRDGSLLEDKSDPFFPAFGTTRGVNHFHNPLKPWNQAGLDDWVAILHYTSESSLYWAQDWENQQSYVEGDWSWQTIRNHYYLALTATTDSERQANFAKTFRGLGHQMHTIQDASQPDHARNNAHPFDIVGLKRWIGIERWAMKNPAIINGLAANPFFPQVSFSVPDLYRGQQLAPITQLIDTTQYYTGRTPSASLAQGLSEYTNANFFSDDTIFAAEWYSPGDRHYFPYPKKSSTDLEDYFAWNKVPETVSGEDNIPDTAFWIKKIADGEQVEHFLKPTYLSSNILSFLGDGVLYRRTFYRDEKCHEDYVKHLIPRAVGYSAALLNYFFRGDLYIKKLVPSNDTFWIDANGEYFFSNDGDTGTDINTVAVFLQNNSMVNGVVEPAGPAGPGDSPGGLTLTIGYTDTSQGAKVYQSAGTFAVTDTIPAAGSGSFLSIQFKVDPPIATKSAKDLTYYFAFRGKLGQEEDAVIGRVVKAPVLSSVSPDRGTAGTVVALTGDNFPDASGENGTQVVDFCSDMSMPYNVEVMSSTDTEITTKVPETACLEKPGYGGLRVRSSWVRPKGEETIYSNPVAFFPIMETQMVNTDPNFEMLVKISGGTPILGDYDQSPPAAAKYSVPPGGSLPIQLMTGYNYDVCKELVGSAGGQQTGSAVCLDLGLLFIPGTWRTPCDF